VYFNTGEESCKSAQLIICQMRGLQKVGRAHALHSLYTSRGRGQNIGKCDRSRFLVTDPLYVGYIYCMYTPMYSGGVCVSLSLSIYIYIYINQFAPFIVYNFLAVMVNGTRAGARSV
jgi:hypothetical protein